jgi:small subunit ribosomal protein S4
MLKLLEKRLDNVVYRLGFADTRLQARQMVSHQHILVNGKKNSIPSYIVRIEDEIALSPSAIKTKLFQEKLSNMVQKERPAWLAWFETEGKQSGKIVSEPEVSDIVSLLEPQRIVELYSK